MKTEADKLRARAAAGEDFDKLQAEVLQFAGITQAGPPTHEGKVRGDMLPTGQMSVMELNSGEVSEPLPDSLGYAIYKVNSKQKLTLEQVRDEIRRLLSAKQRQDAMQAILKSVTTTLDPVYFGK